MQLCIGQFVFTPDDLSFTDLQRQRAWNYAENSVASGRAPKQYIGPGEDSVTLNGIVYQEHGIGTRQSIENLADMASTGQGYVVMDGSGYLYGVYVIESISENKSILVFEGVPRKIEFNVTLKRVDDDRIEQPQISTSTNTELG